jgi:hypothetical protein
MCEKVMCRWWFEIALRREESGRKWERMTDGKGRTRWEKGENKSRGTRSGSDEPKNVRELERVVG